MLHCGLSHIALPKTFQRHFHLKLVFSWSSRMYSKNSIRDDMVWHILSIQGSYRNVHLTLIYLLVLKIYWKIVSGTLFVDICSPLQRFHQVFMKSSCIFFCFKSLSGLRNLNHGQFCLNYIVHLENIDQLLSK